MKWENSNFYPKKYENFHDCALTISVTSNDMFGLLKKVFEERLKAYLVPGYDSDEAKKTCDLITIEYPVIDQYGVFLSYPHRDKVLTFMIGPGEPYTDLERMFKMFDFETWMAITATLIIGLLATLSLNFVSVKIKKFIAGRDVQCPTMNFIAIFLTGGQQQTPGRNFARFIFILFVIWSLIIRTCHQSMLFELLQADLRRPTIKTLDDLFKSNLTSFEREGAILFDEYFMEQMSRSLTRCVVKMSMTVLIFFQFQVENFHIS